MSAIKKKPPEPDDESWMGTYADAITLLMAFFVMLVSISKVDIPLYEKVAAGLAKEIGKRETISPITLLQEDIKKIQEQQSQGPKAEIGTDADGLVMEFASNGFFRPGSADLLPEAIPSLERVSQTLLAPRYDNFGVEVEGHTDDIPIATRRFPSNWELSGARATNVVRTLIGMGLAPKRLRATAYAETQPKAPNRTATGEAITENMAENRRIVIRLHPQPIQYDLPDIGRRTPPPEGGPEPETNFEYKKKKIKILGGGEGIIDKIIKMLGL